MLVPANYIISYKQRSLSPGGTWWAPFQDHTDQLFACKRKQTLWNQRGHGNNLLLCLSFCNTYYNDMFKC